MVAGVDIVSAKFTIVEACSGDDLYDDIKASG